MVGESKLSSAKHYIHDILLTVYHRSTIQRGSSPSGPWESYSGKYATPYLDIQDVATDIDWQSNPLQWCRS
jgi:hypothetical protein